MSNSPNQPAISESARTTQDSMGLGRTSGQRTAEMVAGLRYQLAPTDLNNALSRLSGQLVGRMMLSMMRNKSQVNYILTRPAIFNQLIRQNIDRSSEKIILVDIAAGFSSRGFEFAQNEPNIQVIEIDLPDVVEEKQRRLTKNAHITIPTNLKWYKADLGVESLSDVLEGKKVDVVSSEGLNPYFTPEDITGIARHVRESLKPGGVYISDIGWHEARQSENQASIGFFKRFASQFSGIVSSEEEGCQLFIDAGYVNVKAHRPTRVKLEDASFAPTTFDYSVIFTAENPKEA